MPKFLFVWSVVTALLPLRLAAQTVRARIILADGQTAQISAPVLVAQANPGVNQPLYRPSNVVRFRRSPRGLEDRALRWADVWRIDYYPVDGGTHCAAILTLSDATKLGLKSQTVFDASDEGITGQLPKGVSTTLQAARWHSEYKPLTAPAVPHQLEPDGAAPYPRVRDVLQCAVLETGTSAERRRVRSIVFTMR